jgi:hypothetical protein
MAADIGATGLQGPKGEKGEMGVSGVTGVMGDYPLITQWNGVTISIDSKKTLFPNMPTSPAGLAVGSLWNSGGTVCIVVK